MKHMSEKTAIIFIGIQAAKDNGYRIPGYYFQSSVSDCIARNQKREGKARIPDQAVAYKNELLFQKGINYNELKFDVDGEWKCCNQINLERK